MSVVMYCIIEWRESNHGLFTHGKLIQYCENECIDFSRAIQAGE